MDKSLDSELVRLQSGLARKLYSKYKDERGAEPAEDVDPTREQISALSQVVGADMAPYVDFSIWGPNGGPNGSPMDSE